MSEPLAYLKEAFEALGEETWKTMLATAQVFDSERSDCLSKLSAATWHAR